MSLDEIIHLTSFNQTWKDTYLSEKHILQPLFGEEIQIEHIGSTSVEGMIAKPVIDIMIGLKTLLVDHETEIRLKGLSYIGFGEAGVAGRFYYRKRQGNNINLQVTIMNSQLWNDNLIFREYLRTHKTEADKYSNMKLFIMNKGIDTLLKYSEQKSNLILELMKNAREWSQGRRDFV